MASLRLSIDARPAKAAAADFDAVAKRIVRNARSIVVAVDKISVSVEAFTKVLRSNKTAFEKAFPEAAADRLNYVRAAAVALREDLAKLGQTSRGTSTAMRTLVPSGQNTRAALSQAATSARGYAADLRNAGSAATYAAERSRVLGRQARLEANALSIYRNSANSLTGSLKQLAGGFTIALAIRGGIRQATEFSDAIGLIKAVSQPTIEELERLKKASVDIGGASIYGPTDAAQGLLELTKAGLNSRQSIEALPSVLAFATLGSLDLKEAADVTAKTLAQFGLDATKADVIIDSLANTANRTTTDVALLASALKFSGPVASSLANDIQSTTAALGVLAQQGIQGSLAGTNLRGILISLLKPTKEAKDRIRALGLSLEDVNPRTKSLIQIFEAFSKAQLDVADSAIIFDRRVAGAGVILSEQIDLLKALTEQNRELSGSSKEAAKDAADTLGGAFKRLGAASTTASIAIGEGFVGKALRQTLEVTTGVILILSGLEDKLESNQKTARFLVNALEAVTYAMTALVAVKIVVWLASVQFGVTLLADALFSLYAIILANPWTALATAVVAVGAAVIAFTNDTEKSSETMLKQQRQMDSLKQSTDDYRQAQERLKNFQQTKNIEDQIGAYDQLIQKIEQVKDQIATGSVKFTKEDLQKFVPEYEFDKKKLEEVKDKIKKEMDKTGFELRPFLDPNQGEVLLKQLEPLYEELAKYSDEITPVQAIEELNKKLNDLVDLRAKLKPKEKDPLIDIDELDRGTNALAQFIGELEEELRLAGKSEDVRKQLTNIRQIETLAIQAQRGDILLLIAQVVAETAAIDALNKAYQDKLKAKKDAEKAEEDLGDLVRDLERQLEVIRAEKDGREETKVAIDAERLSRLANTESAKEQANTAITLAQAIDTERAAQERLKAATQEATKAQDELEQEKEAQRRASGQATQSVNEIVDALELEANTLHLSNEAREQAILLRNIELAAMKGQVDDLGALTDRALKALDTVQRKSKIKDLADGISSDFGSALETVLRQSEDIGDAIVGLFQEVALEIQRALLIKPLTNLLSTQLQSLFGSLFAGPPAPSSTGNILPSSTGNVFVGSKLYPSSTGNVFNSQKITPHYGGGVVTSRTTFPMADGGTGSMTEYAQPEAVVPLFRSASGVLGIANEGGGDREAGTVINQRNSFNIYADNPNAFRGSEGQIVGSVNRKMRKKR